MTKEISDFMKDIYHDEESERELLKMLVRRHGGLYNYLQVEHWNDDYEHETRYYHIPSEWSEKMKSAAHDVISLCHDSWVTEIFSFESPSEMACYKPFQIVLRNWTTSGKFLTIAKKQKMGLKRTYQTTEEIVDSFRLIFDEMMKKASNFKFSDDKLGPWGRWSERRSFPQTPLFYGKYKYEFEYEGETYKNDFTIKKEEDSFPTCFDEPLDVKLREIIFHRLDTGKCFPL